MNQKPHTQFYQVSNNAHDQEAHSHRLRDLDELALIWLRATVHERRAVADKVARDLGELGQGVGHGGDF